MATTLTLGLQSYWKLDETSGQAIDEKGNNNLFGHGVERNQAGKINTSYYFQMNIWPDVLRSGNQNTFLSSFTLSAWVFRDASTARQVIFSVGYNRYVGFNNNRLIFYNGSDTILSNANIPTGQWVHVVVTFDTSGALKGYVNSALNVSTTSFYYPIWEEITLGARLLRSPGSSIVTFSNGLNSRLDEVGFWSRALTDDEVVELYNGGAGLSYPFEIPASEQDLVEYGTKWFCTHIVGPSDNLTTYRIEIQQKNYSGTSDSIKASRDVFRHEYETIDVENAFNNSIQKSRFEFHILVRNDDDLNILEQIYDADETEFRIVKKVDGNVEWTGFIVPGMLEYQEARYPFEGSIVAKDLTYLESTKYPLKAVDDYQEQIIETIAGILNILQYGLNIRVYSDWSYDGISPDDDILNQMSINAYHLRIYGSQVNADTQITMYQALEYLLRPFNLLLRQVDNRWELINVNYLIRNSGVVNYYEYDFTGTQITNSATEINSTTVMNNVDKYLLPISMNRFMLPMKSIEIAYRHKSNLKGIRTPGFIFQFNDEPLDIGTVEFDDLENNLGVSVFIIAAITCQVDNQANLPFINAKYILRTDNYSWNNAARQWELIDPNAYVNEIYSINVLLLNTYQGSVLYDTDPVPTGSNGSEGPVRLILMFADDSSEGHTPTQIRWMASITIKTDGDLENLYYLYRITQGKQVAQTKTLEPTIFGIPPALSSRSGIAHNDGSSGKVKIENKFYRIGVDEERDPIELLLIELMDLFRNPIRNMDDTFLGTYSPHQVISYRGNLFFFLSGVQVGRNNSWTTSNFMQMRLQESTTDFVEILSKDEIEGGGVGGSGGGGPTPGGGAGGNEVIMANLELKVDKDGGDEQLLYYPNDVDSNSILNGYLLTGNKVLLKIALDRLVELLTEVIETKVDEDGGDAFMLYYPEDDDNISGFFAGLLSASSLTVRSALDRIVDYVKGIGGSAWSGLDFNINTVNTYGLTPNVTSGNNAPSGLFLQGIPILPSSMFVEGTLVIYGDGVKTEDWYWGRLESTGVVAVALANLQGNEQMYWNGTINGARNSTIVFGDLQSYFRIDFLNASVHFVEESSAGSASASASASASDPDAAHELILSTSPYAYLRFNETSGTTANDETENGNDFTYVDTPTLNQASIIPNDDGPCISTVGNSGYVRRTRATIIHGTSAENIGIYMVVSRVQLASGAVFVGFGSTSDADSKLVLRLSDTGSFNVLSISYVSNGGTTRNSVGSFVIADDTDDVYRIYLEWTPGTSTFAVYINEFTTPDVGVDNAPAFACNTTDIAIGGVYKETGAGAALQNHLEAKFDNFVIWFGTLPSLSTIDDIDTLFGF